MSTIIYQGPQSGLESQISETRTLRFKLALSKPSFFETIEQPIIETSYVQPMLKRSSSMLSTKSLELCTENLGSETGTDTIEISKFSLSPPAFNVGEETKTGEESKSPKHMVFSRKVVSGNSRNFPPPLTTMSGSSSLRPHREGGRLVIRVVEDPPPLGCFRVERSRGRLRLSFWKDSEMVAEESEEDSDMEEVESEGDSDEGEEEEEGEAESDGNSLDVGGEMGIEKFQRPSWCNEGGCGNGSVCNWEPVSVALSAAMQF